MKCKYCGKEFSKRFNHQKYCSPECLRASRRAYNRQWSRRNRVKVNIAKKRFRVKRRIELKTRAVNLLGGCCQNCGYSKCIEALDFHHRDEEKKDFSISNAFKNYMDWKMIESELRKCVLLCSNCHRELHAKQKR